MDSLEIVYMICFLFGLALAVVSALMAGVFTGGVDAAMDIDAGGHVHFAPLSPAVIATFTSAFGGAGMILNEFGLSPVVQIPAAAGAAGALGMSVSYLFYRLTKAAEKSSEARTAEMIGLEAQISAPIPAGGVGEISYTVAGSRYTAPARTMDGKEAGAQTVVRIAKMVGNLYYVQRLNGSDSLSDSRGR